MPILPSTRPPSPQAQREVRSDTPLRRARTCYGHLAGVAGVNLMDELLGRGWLEIVPPDPDAIRIHYAPTPAGVTAFIKRGVTIPIAKPRKPIGFSCIDWTERRAHLGGALGRSIVSALAAADCIEQTLGSRVVALTGSLDRWLGS
jgi:hypothetical protein